MKLAYAAPDSPNFITFFTCGAEGTRTPDPLHAMEVRYQLRHSPAIARESIPVQRCAPACTPASDHRPATRHPRVVVQAATQRCTPAIAIEVSAAAMGGHFPAAQTTHSW